MVVHEIGKGLRSTPSDSKTMGDSEYISFRDVWRFVQRHWLIFALFTAAGLGIGIFYTVTTQPIYLATTRLVMDPDQGRIVSQDAFTGTVIIEAAEIASQVEIVKSEAIARAVVQKLNLTEDPEIIGGMSWQAALRDRMRAIASYFRYGDDGAKTEASDDDVMRRTMASFLSRVSVNRVGQSYILEIGYSSVDPTKAAQAANAIAEAYISTGLSDRASAAQSGARWLETRLIEVGRQAREASMGVEEFRAKNGIMEISKSSSLDQQQLSEISSQAVAAKAQTAAESAKLVTLNQLMAGSKIEGDVDETMNNPRIQKLQEDLGVATTKLNNLRSRYDADNPAVIAAQQEIDRVKGDMRKEFERIQSVYRANLDVAKTRERLLSDELTSLKDAGTDKNLARVELSEMESRATTYRRMYESILQQLIGALQKESFPLGNVRVVTAAAVPLSKTWPKSSFVLPFTAMLGLAAGVMAALLRDGLDRRVSSSEKLRRELGISSLGHVPVYVSPPFLSGSMVATNATWRRTMLPLRSVLDTPYSQFSEALRGVKHSIDSAFPPNAPMVVGITSVGTGEGKTTIATNLAQLYQHEGASVVLIDADFLNARLSCVVTESGTEFGMEALSINDVPRRYAVAQEGGLLVAKSDHEPEAEIVQGHGGVPVVTVDETEKSVATFQRYGHLPALKAEIDLLRRRYKVVIVDMSAFEDSADTRVICSYLEGIIVVVGQTNKMTVERLSDALASFGTSAINVLGIIANRSYEKRHGQQTRLWRRRLDGRQVRASARRLTGHATSRPLKIALGIASSGRRDILSSILPHIANQTRKPDEIIVCLSSPEDIDPSCLRNLDIPVQVLISERGLCRQRNRILDNVKHADVVLFLDDDFLMTSTYVEEAERLFQLQPDVAMCTGKVLADGITGPGISVRDGLRLVDGKRRRRSEPAMQIRPIYNAYGCNMAIRMAIVRAAALRFDENLPFYGWLEDVDFSRLVAHYGLVVSARQLEGVHLGTKGGRAGGVRLGYSQIANPLYLMRKRTMSVPQAAAQIGRNLAANLVKVWRPEPWVDRKGRLKGNVMAFRDLLKGRLAPQNIEALE
ncbi:MULTISPECIES: Wzz/FepE/Etk N-terminal domain-containing protein [unclassified Rhizobium]|uniref:nucleotide-binding protein n=1 Tax=unclassified Rhizobium TaxID=2613769 RepID=UPI000EA89A58|nr:MULTISPECIES: Wzz/FepE/Etk N-terminal domain-containing protein [unclassified Rhizobium]AYG69896.1 glycosyltransferase [Rhizobium sp. CCGE531]AYG76276.1 glycosyltransferase [Rhizobium sp. CCGE532]